MDSLFSFIIFFSFENFSFLKISAFQSTNLISVKSCQGTTVFENEVIFEGFN